MTKWLVANPQSRIEYTIKETPLLHACCAKNQLCSLGINGDTRIDIRPEVKPNVVCDITKNIPFPNNSFAAAFADFPWTATWKHEVASAMKELLRVAPIVYTISPWIYGASSCYPEKILVQWMPGVQQALLFTKYIRKEGKAGLGGFLE